MRDNSRERRGDSRKRSNSPPQRGTSPMLGEKLALIKPYQQLFPRNDLSDSTYRPILIGKSRPLSFRIHGGENRGHLQLHSLEHFERDELPVLRRGRVRVSMEQVPEECGTLTPYKQVYYHQGLINLLYSVKKLNNNEDLLMFDRFVQEQYSFQQFVSFLTYREIFQSLTKIIIFGRLC